MSTAQQKPCVCGSEGAEGIGEWIEVGKLETPWLRYLTIGGEKTQYVVTEGELP